MARSPTNVRLQVAQLESREVPSVDFVSALGLTGDTGGSSAQDVAVDAAGNSYLTGSFHGTVDFDPAATHPGDTDILTADGADVYVAKYAPDNSLLWVVRTGSSTGGVAGNNAYGQTIDVDATGNVYIAGYFTGTATFGPNTLTASGNDGFVSKLGPAGTVLWARRWGQVDTGGGLGDRGIGVDTDAAGNVYVLGSRTKAFVSPTNGNGYDVLKFSPTGAPRWALFFNTKASPTSGDLAVDPTGSVFMTGAFSGTVDFDPANNKTKNMYLGGAFVLKLTSAGGFGWVSTLTNASGQSLTRDASGNVIVGGYYSGTPGFSQYGAGNMNLPTGLPSSGGGFITKLSSSGALTWAKAIEITSTVGFTTVFVRGLATDAAGNIYATGTIQGSADGTGGTADFDPGAGVQNRTSAGGTDTFVLKWTSYGSFAWAETFGNSGYDYVGGIALDTAGTIHLAGNYKGTVDFDPDPLDTYNLTNLTTSRHMFHVQLRQN